MRISPYFKKDKYLYVLTEEYGIVYLPDLPKKIEGFGNNVVINWVDNSNGDLILYATTVNNKSSISEMPLTVIGEYNNINTL